jgi:hypothetical protein
VQRIYESIGKDLGVERFVGERSVDGYQCLVEGSRGESLRGKASC